MNSRVLFARYDLKVFWPVVAFVPINVVDYLIRSKPAACDSFRDHSMFVASVEFTVRTCAGIE
jgi:hypothetical protein